MQQPPLGQQPPPPQPLPQGARRVTSEPLGGGKMSLSTDGAPCGHRRNLSDGSSVFGSGSERSSGASGAGGSSSGIGAGCAVGGSNAAHSVSWDLRPVCADKRKSASLRKSWHSLLQPSDVEEEPAWDGSSPRDRRESGLSDGGASGGAVLSRGKPPAAAVSAGGGYDAPRDAARDGHGGSPSEIQAPQTPPSLWAKRRSADSRDQARAHLTAAANASLHSACLTSCVQPVCSGGHDCVLAARAHRSLAAAVPRPHPSRAIPPTPLACSLCAAGEPLPGQEDAS
eukprot:3838686-Prymnesium_polylepis.3